jgi:hypothetical protein
VVIDICEIEIDTKRRMKKDKLSRQQKMLLSLSMTRKSVLPIAGVVFYS